MRARARFTRPAIAAGRCLALTLLKRPVQPASRSANAEVPVVVVGLLRCRSTGPALRALAHDTRPVMHSHVIRGGPPPAAGRCLALTLLKRPVQSASRSADAELPADLLASGQQYKCSGKSTAGEETGHWHFAACGKATVYNATNNSNLELQTCSDLQDGCLTKTRHPREGCAIEDLSQNLSTPTQVAHRRRRRCTPRPPASCAGHARAAAGL